MKQVLNEHETLQHILSTGCSISRFGDGELRLISGSSAPGQRIDKLEIGEHLKKVLDNPIKNHLSCVPVPGAFMPEKKMKFWMGYFSQVKKITEGKNDVFGSSFIGRTDSAPQIDNSVYWEKCRNLFKGQHVLIFCGVGKHPFPDSSIFEYAFSFRYLFGPDKNAYGSLNSIMSVLLKQKKVDTFVLSLGPTATVLAYELCKFGVRALDLGRLGVYYSERTQI